ncbi:MAG: protein BatD [Verrucomicrobia bacterium]|nr:protein BatD [Verrucomicrobiota bacterium]
MTPAIRIGERLARSHHRTRGFLSAWLLVCLLCAASALRAAEPPTAEAQLSRPTTEVGVPVDYRLKITGGQPSTDPAAPRIDGIEVVSGPDFQSSNTIMFDGRNMRMQRTTIYTFRLLPTRPGTFTIPASSLQLDGATVQTRPLTLTVMPAGNTGSLGAGRAAPRSNAPGGGSGNNNDNARLDQLIFAELIVPKKTAYVGEAIPCEVRLYLSARARLLEADGNPQLSGEGFSAGKFSQPQTGLQSVEGAPFQVVIYKTVLTAAKTGTLTIGPVEVTPTVQLPGRRPRLRSFGGFDEDVFDNFPNAFFFSPPQQVQVKSEPVNIEARPLPTAGQPANFSGAIGRFELGTPEVNPKAGVTAGDPLTVRVPVKGKGNFDRIAPPALADASGLHAYPPTSKFKADDEVGLSGLKTFEQVLIPQGPRDALPRYRFNYFDPGEGRYVELQTAPLAVRVAPGADPTPSPTAASDTAATAAAAATSTPAPSATPPPPVRDILYIRSDYGPPVRRLAEAFRPVWQQRSFWLAQSLPAGALLAFAAWAFTRRRARNDALRRRAALAQEREALRRTLREERTGRREFYTAAARWLELSGKDNGARLPSEVSADGVNDDAAVQAIIRRRDELTYSGGGVGEGEPLSAGERREVLATLAAHDVPHPAAAAAPSLLPAELASR